MTRTKMTGRMSTGPKAADIAREREERLRKEMGDEAYERMEAEVMPMSNTAVPANAPVTREAPSLRVNVPARKETSAANEPASAMSRRRRKKSKKTSVSSDPEYISTRPSDQSMMSEPVHPEKKRKLLTCPEPLQEQELENEQDQDDDMDLEDVPAETRADVLDVPVNAPMSPTKRRSMEPANVVHIDVSPTPTVPVPPEAQFSVCL